jgi:miniconductance mechanosensitive channel
MSPHIRLALYASSVVFACVSAASAFAADVPQGPEGVAPAITAPAVEPTATERAALELVRAVEQTALGSWLREHPVAWNALAIVALFAIGFALKLVLQRVLGTVIARALERGNKKRLSDALAASRVVGPIAALAPLLLVARMVSVLGDAGILNPLVSFNVSNIVVALAVLRGIGIASSLMKTVDEVYSSRPEVNRPEALRGYRQVLMVVFGLAGGISAAAIAVGKSPVVFLAALGAAAAVIGVVFKDVLFSLVANLLLTANDAIRVGDWIEMKQHSIDGRIAEIKTTSVRVQNADGTVHSVPIGRFIQEPYLNYRSRYGSPGRRVRRALRVDLRTVRALGADDLQAIAAVPSLAGALSRARSAAGDAPITNLCVFRAYAERTLAAHSSIDPTLPVVVSQQEASATGIPVDILCFIKPDAAPDLSSVEGALLDRLTLALPMFALRAYQQGSDLGPVAAPLPWLGADDLAAAGAART